MAWFKRKAKARGGLCDVCNDDLNPADAYWLTPEQVKSSEAYWTRRFRVSAGFIQAISGTGTAASYFDNTLQVTEDDDTPWAICERCTELFVLDRAEARQYALSRTPPPGCAAVPSARIALPAARAWERVFGEWPASVPRP